MSIMKNIMQNGAKLIEPVFPPDQAAWKPADHIIA